jgi:hypothetical protein
MSSRVETSRFESFKPVLRDSSTSLGMTKNVSVAILLTFVLVQSAIAQESPIGSPSPTPEETPAASPARSVRLSFVPPPAEGTISLGIFDADKKLVRVLHREAKIDNFTIEENSISTSWDGKNDAGRDLPPGKYHARGYMVEHRLNVIDTGEPAEPPPTNASDHIAVKLEVNPLTGNRRSVVELAVGFDASGACLKTMDGLPLRAISQTPNVVRASITKQGDTVANVWEDSGSRIERYQLVNVHAMMAFDCGDFELK